MLCRPEFGLSNPPFTYHGRRDYISGRCLDRLRPYVAPARRRRRAFSVEHLRRQRPRLPAHRPTERRALAHRCARHAPPLPHRRTLRRLHHLFHLRGRRPRPLATATHTHRRRLPLLEPRRRFRPPWVRPSPHGLIAHGRASAKLHFSPVSQRGAPTHSPRSSAFARAILTSATTFSATAFLLPNGWPCKARTNASSLSPVPSSPQQRAPRCSFAAWRFPCALMDSARREGIFGMVSWFDRLLSFHHIHSGRQMFPLSAHALALQRIDLLRTVCT